MKGGETTEAGVVDGDINLNPRIMYSVFVLLYCSLVKAYLTQILGVNVIIGCHMALSHAGRWM